MSRWGWWHFADQAGPFARTVRDNALMLEGMAGHDPKDPTSAPIDVPNFEASISGDLKG